MNSFFNVTQILADYVEFNLILKVILFYFAALWVSLIIWVTRDAINRSNNLIFQIFVIILNIVLPIFGLVIYLIIRPTKTLLERYYEDLEYRALVDNGDEKETCSNCKIEISREYEFCPSCGDKLRQACLSCHKEFPKKWQICPYCGVKNLKLAKEDKTSKAKTKN